MTAFERISTQILEEADRAARLHGSMNSPHEAYGLLKEEVDEFWDEVKKFNPAKGRDTRPAMRDELIQVAATCIRAIHHIVDNGKIYPGVK
jgi:hypothetical protein